jgi:hypothetical protein
MSALSPGEFDRMVELLDDRALGVLSAEDAVELEALLGRSGASGAAAGEAADAVVTDLLLDQFSDRPTAEAMPESLRGRLVARGEGLVSGEPAGRIGPAPVASGGWIGWTVAAAALLLAAIGWLKPIGTGAVVPEQRLAQLENDPDTIVLPFAGMGDLEGASGVGEIVWNPRLQEGFLRLSQLPDNDPSQGQYQLWIFDTTRDTYPVDGGVFNVADRATGEYLVPFEPRLGVGDATAFAVTKERPGGVVVTDKAGLVLYAPVPTDG